MGHVAHSLSGLASHGRAYWLALGLSRPVATHLSGASRCVSPYILYVVILRPDSYLCLSEQGQPAVAAGLRLDRSGQASREGCLPGQPFLQLTRSVRQQVASEFIPAQIGCFVSGSLLI